MIKEVFFAKGNLLLAICLVSTFFGGGGPSLRRVAHQPRVSTEHKAHCTNALCKMTFFCRSEASDSVRPPLKGSVDSDGVGGGLTEKEGG